MKSVVALSVLIPISVGSNRLQQDGAGTSRKIEDGATPGRVPDSANPSNILAKAIAAHGGSKQILKRRKGYMTWTDNSHDGQITMKEVFDLPSQWKHTTEGKLEGKAIKSYLLKTRGRVWEWQEGGQAREMRKGKLTAPLSFGTLIILAQLYHKNAPMSLLPDKNIHGTRCTGVRIHLNSDVADCYFDTTTSRLTQWELNIDSDKKRFRQKILFGDFRKIDGVLLPHRERFYLKEDMHPYALMGDFVVTAARIGQELPPDTFTVPGKR